MNHLSEGRARPGYFQSHRALVEWTLGALVVAVPWWVGIVELVRWLVR